MFLIKERTMKTVNIKGKDYVMIHERIKYFRDSEEYKGWSLISSIISHENGIILIQASILDENGVVRSTGLAQEKESDGFINKTSYVENCETSAWGRALGNMGIGIDASIASADEVQNAIKNQTKPELTPDNPKWAEAVDYMSTNGNLDAIKGKYFISQENEKLLKNGG